MRWCVFRDQVMVAVLAVYQDGGDKQPYEVFDESLGEMLDAGLVQVAEDEEVQFM